MESVLVIRQTFWELEEVTPKGDGRQSRSFSDFDVRYGGALASLSEDSTKIDSDATADTCSSAGSSADFSYDTDAESDESENSCATPRVPEQQQVQHVMMPMQFVMVPVAQTKPNVAPPPGNFAPQPRKFMPPPGNLLLPPASPPGELVKPLEVSEKTTVVLRNLPSELSRSEFVQMLDDAGFSERYDFVYLPTNFRNMTVFGYAIINFCDAEDAQAAMEHFRGMHFNGQDVITEWSKSQQGYDDLVCRYRDSPVMHSSVPDKHKPIILAAGRLQPFPPPTQMLQPPRKFASTEE
jgi:hypothetical protein